MLFLLAAVLTGSSASWADNYVVLTQSIKIGNDEGGWGGNTIPASAFTGFELQQGDVIEISRSGTASNDLQVTAGDWSDNFNFYAHYGWTTQTESVEIKDYTNGTAAQIIAKIKEKGLILNGTGPNNLKVRVLLKGNNRITLSGTISYNGLTDKVAQIGNPVTYTYTLDPKFADVQNVKYKWFITDETVAGDNKELIEGDGYVCKYVRNNTNNTWGTSNTFTFYPHSSTSDKQLTVCVHVSADGYGTKYDADWGHVTIAPVPTPTFTQNGTEVTLSANTGYWVEHKINNGTAVPTYGNSTQINNLNEGDVITAHTTKHFNVDGKDYYRGSTEVTYTYYKLNDINVNGTDRQYAVYAPQGISGKVGVVVSLHGASNDFNNGRVNFNGIADSEKNVDNKKFVVVYPRGLMRQLRGTERGWESYTENNTEDVDFFKAIVNNLNQQFNGQFSIDYNRIYLAGFSNGGMMAYKAAHQAGDFFAAFASVGGFPVNESHLFHAGVQPTPFIHIQGEDDGVFPSSDYDVNTIIHNMVYRNGAQFNPWDGSDMGRVQQDGNMISENNNSGTKVVTKDCHSAVAGGADYFFYKIKGMGHTWSYNWDGVDGDDVASTMWKFFNKADKVKSLDKTLKFRLYDTNVFWGLASDLGFDNVNTGTSVLSYGGLSKTNENKNIYHSLQFKGVVGGTPHFLKLNITTTGATATDYFIIKLVKTGETTPVVIRRYQANAVGGDYNINFDALNGWNEYKLVVERSRADLDVKVNGVEFHSGSAVENKAFFPTDLNTVLSGMNPIYQPVFGQTYDGIAKEYIPIANIPANDKVTIADILKADGNAVGTINSSSTTEDNGAKWFYNIAISNKEGEEKGHKSKNLYVLGSDYTWNSTNGIALSHNGPAGMPAYVAGSGDFPTKGVVAMKVQGTFNLTFLLLNEASSSYADGTRNLKVYYTNDQLNGELKEWKNWDFYGTRNETNANGRNPLEIAVRMAQLGQDGTCTVFLTYEGAQSDDMVWLKGIIAVRPNLDVTIGRTDKLRYKDGNPINAKNDKLTCFGENKPYQWNFGTSSFSAINPENGAEAKKINKFDGRTYVTGLGPNGEDLGDHLLVFSDGAGDDKASFDGRPSNGRHKGFEDDLTDMNEHIEFNHPTKYSGTHASGAEQEGFDKNRRSFTPILSNGLKVNVTGSGWFTIACSAPNGAVNMKVLSSTNGGTAYMNLLREFRVEKSNDPKPETDWQTYRVYLKAHAEKDGDDGFWAGDYLEHDAVYGTDVPKLDPEDTQMSLYVVFDAIGDESGYTDNSAQLNIHYLQWINEMPGDYVFQQEEDPKLLNTLQSVVEGGTVEKPGLYWQAGNDNMWESEANKAVIPTVNTTTKSYPSAYNSGSYTETKDGQDSGNATISQQLGIKWDVAANALTESHTEAAAAGEAYQYVDGTQYALPTDATNEFDIPISGSFFRFMPMKNQYISTWIVPTNGAKIFVLDETGQPIPFINGGDMQSVNKSKIDAVSNARERGWVAYAPGLTAPTGDVKYFTAGISTAVRIDFAALAGKEYFIVSKEGRISLARLKATNNAYRANMEEVAQALTLNNDAANNTSAIQAAMNGTGRYATSVTLNRDFTANQWASLVLPFSMNEQKFKEVFGKDAICLHFTDVDLTTNTVNLTHHFYNMIVAGRPVLVRPSADGSIVNGNKTISDVTLQTSAVIPNVNGSFTFTGSFDNASMPANSLFISGNAVKHASKAKDVKALRAWFVCSDLEENPSAAGARAARFVNYDGTLMDEDMATGIETALAESGMDATVISASTVIYNLQGNKVATGAEMQNLPAGVYVVKGKKFIVK